jgi:hypothetical protein
MLGFFLSLPFFFCVEMTQKYGDGVDSMDALTGVSGATEPPPPIFWKKHSHRRSRK